MVGDRPGDRHPLLLATGQGARQVPLATGEAERLEQLDRPRTCRRGAMRRLAAVGARRWPSHRGAGSGCTAGRHSRRVAGGAAARSAAASAVISSSPRRTEPASGTSRPPSRCNIVDLPHPLGPIAATHSPRSTSSDRPRSTGRSTSSVWNDFSRLWASNRTATKTTVRARRPSQKGRTSRTDAVRSHPERRVPRRPRRGRSSRGRLDQLPRNRVQGVDAPVGLSVTFGPIATTGDSAASVVAPDRGVAEGEWSSEQSTATRVNKPRSSRQWSTSRRSCRRRRALDTMPSRQRGSAGGQRGPRCECVVALSSGAPGRSGRLRCAQRCRSMGRCCRIGHRRHRLR